MDLHKRREELAADHKAMEKHNPYHQAEAREGRRVSDRPVAFLCDDEVVVIGDDVTKVLDGVQAFIGKATERGAEDPDAPGVATKNPYQARAEKEPTVAHALKWGRRLLDGDRPVELRVSQQVWNSVLFCLNEVGINVVLTDGTFAPESN